MGLLDLHFTDEVLVDLQRILMERMQAHPENVTDQAKIEKAQHQLDRLRELYAPGYFTRDPYMAACAGKMAQLTELEQELGGADYPIGRCACSYQPHGKILREGNRKQQRRAINLLFDKILVGATTKIKGVELQKWAQPLFADLLMISGDTVCPQETSNARHVATPAGLTTHDEDHPSPIH